MLVLAGIGVIVLGFLLRVNPLVVIAAAALATGLAAGQSLLVTLAIFGKAFASARFVSAALVVLPLIGLLERSGLRERAADFVGRMRNATLGRLLIVYLLVRQVSAAVGLSNLGGQVQMVRPLLGPMARAAADRQGAGEAAVERSLALAAATDNIGLFFGEDVFVAISSVLLMKSVMDGYGYALGPLQLSIWAIPTAIAAFLIHATRLLFVDARLRKVR